MRSVLLAKRWVRRGNSWSIFVSWKYSSIVRLTMEVPSIGPQSWTPELISAATGLPAHPSP